LPQVSPVVTQRPMQPAEAWLASAMASRRGANSCMVCMAESLYLCGVECFELMCWVGQKWVRMMMSFLCV